MKHSASVAKKLAELRYQNNIGKVQWILDIIQETMLKHTHHYIELQYDEVFTKAKELGYNDYQFNDLVKRAGEIGSYEIQIMTRYHTKTEHLIIVQIPDEIMENQERTGP